MCAASLVFGSYHDDELWVPIKVALNDDGDASKQHIITVVVGCALHTHIFLNSIWLFNFACDLLIPKKVDDTVHSLLCAFFSSRLKAEVALWLERARLDDHKFSTLYSLFSLIGIIHTISANSVPALFYIQRWSFVLVLQQVECQLYPSLFQEKSFKILQRIGMMRGEIISIRRALFHYAN